jgi:hypothetical protein
MWSDSFPVAAASGAVGTEILAPHLSVERTYSNVFSILRAAITKLEMN